MIGYSDLHARLIALERGISSALPAAFTGSAYVRTNLSPVQGFALDSSNKDRGKLPIVVALGSNYTQGKEKCPRDSANRLPAVEDNLSLCRARVHEAFNALNTSWFSCGKASSGLSSVGWEDWHLVMTNFCLWNTTVRWQQIPGADRKGLLQNSPVYSSARTCSAPWPHLSAVAGALSGLPVLWIAHGIHSEVFELFDQFRNQLANPAWIKTPNLSFRYFFYGQRYPR